MAPNMNEFPIMISFEKEDEEDEISFLEPMDENIMAHLLSRGDDDDDTAERSQGQEQEEEEEEELQEGELEFDSPGLFFCFFAFFIVISKILAGSNRATCR